MNRVLVSSSDIRSVGYDSRTSILEVEFNSGEVYQYFDVPEHLHLGLMSSNSHGQFLNEYIKYSYRYTKVS